MRAIVMVAVGLLMVGCAKPDPTLAGGVERHGGGVYSVSELGYWNITTQAVKQCQIDRGTLNIMTNTFERGGYSGKQYAKIIFKCDKKTKKV